MRYRPEFSKFRVQTCSCIGVIFRPAPWEARSKKKKRVPHTDLGR
jgi:hypothetical protein